MEPLALQILPGNYCVHKLPLADSIPEAVFSGSFCSVTRTAEELSIVCDSRVEVESEEKEEGFSCIRISGPLEFSLLGILSGISAILADGGISIFAVSTYETDYLLFRSEKIDAVKSLLQKAGHTVSGKPLLD